MCISLSLLLYLPKFHQCNHSHPSILAAEEFLSLNLDCSIRILSLHEHETHSLRNTPATPIPRPASVGPETPFGLVRVTYTDFLTVRCIGAQHAVQNFLLPSDGPKPLHYLILCNQFYLHLLPHVEDRTISACTYNLLM